AITGITADSSGSTYLTGWTESLDMPISGAEQAYNRGGVDSFIVKLNAAGTGLGYATYIGGSGDDRAAGIAVDASGQAYVAGSTSSSNFPLSAPVRSTLGGGRDAFALKLNSSGSSLVYSTFLGGSGWDQGTGIAVDGSGNAYICGDTQSSDFHIYSASQSTFGGQTDAFVVKLNSSGGVTYSTFLGGSGTQHAGGIAVSGGNAYVAGGTTSSNFPVLSAFRSTP